MWFSKGSNKNRDFEAEFTQLTAQLQTPPADKGPRDYSLAEDDPHFIPPTPDPLPKLPLYKYIGIALIIVILITLTGLGIAQIVLPIWARITCAILFLIGVGAILYPRRKTLTHTAHDSYPQASTDLD